MSGFFVSNTLGTFNAESKNSAFNLKNAETTKTFAATTANAKNGDGLSTIAAGTTFKDIWASSSKSAQVFKDTQAYRSNDGDRKELPGSSTSALYTFRTYSGEKTDRISLYDDDARRPNKGSYLVGALRIKPKPGVRITFDLLTFKCSKLLGYLKNGADEKLTANNPWGTNQEGSVGSTSFNSSWNEGNYRCVRFTLDGDKGDYLEIDMDGGVMSGNNFYVKTGGTWYGTSKQPDDICTDEIRVDVIFKGAASTAKEGCMDSVASNYNKDATKDNKTCLYNTAGVTKFEVTPNEVKTGERINISWNLANSNFSSIKCLMNGTDIMPRSKRSSKTQNFNYVPTSEETKNFELVVYWNKAGIAGNKKSVLKTVSVVTPITFVVCTDPNRAKDSNDECADCNAGYYLENGLCTTCEDPNRNTDSNGQCKSCMSGYAENTDGSCQKVGCMTYADGSSAADDYEYDPDAVVNDSTMCQGKEEEDDDPDIDPVLEEIDCELSDWADWSDYTDWSDAATASGTRTRTRSRTIVTNVQAGGAICGALEETETETGEIDPNTGEVTIITTTTEDATKVTPTTTSPVIPIILGVAGLGVLALLMRR